MAGSKNIAFAITVALMIVGLGALVPHAQAADDKVVEGIATVIDAGTIKIDDKVLKLHGLIAPSARQKCRKGALPWLCGAAARMHLVNLAQNQTVRCLKVGDYHARCFKSGTDLGENLVRNGWAVPAKSGMIYHDDEDAARKDKLGMWKYAK
jgi:endonuclease YncB( thermonuclease family)